MYLVSACSFVTNIVFLDIDTLRVFLDEVNPGTFDDLEIDDISVERVE